jgi:hypothetical protein
LSSIRSIPVAIIGPILREVIMGGHDAARTRSSSTGCAARNPESGGEAIQVTDCRLDTNHGVWSPDGKRFAFSYAFGGPVAKQVPRTRVPRHRDRHEGNLDPGTPEYAIA